MSHRPTDRRISSSVPEITLRSEGNKKMQGYTKRSKPTLPYVAIAAISASLLLTGCSGQERQAEKGKDVASLPPSTSSRNSSAEPGTEKSTPAESSDGTPGVQLRLDDTSEKRLQIRKTYAGCLAENGMGENANGQVSDGVRRKAEEACKDKAPINPPELDPAKNPHYGEDVVAVVKCLTSHGVPAVIVPATDSGPVGWTLTSADVPDDYEQVNLACMVKSFGSPS
ncbi:hypothetical protein [Streptomyces sp. NBC_00343]|uniref:hypothetical protein n=1 Tax=Streptomyces sp. NBC_00343 TaxID=2975719 RepID=UPI002E296A1E|nr:hypothetical protein [Streptomyces sp. NBC_00343]